MHPTGLARNKQMRLHEVSQQLTSVIHQCGHGRGILGARLAGDHGKPGIRVLHAMVNWGSPAGRVADEVKCCRVKHALACAGATDANTCAHNHTCVVEWLPQMITFFTSPGLAPRRFASAALARFWSRPASSTVIKEMR